MAEINATDILNGADASPEVKTPDENIATPADIGNPEHGGDGTVPGEQPQVEPEPPLMDTPEKPVVSDGEVVVPSNIIDGVFGDKLASAQESEQKATEMDEGKKDTPETKRRGRQPETDKAAETEMPKKAERSPRLPKGPKDKQAANIGGGIGGNSGQTPAKDETSPTPAAPPEPLKDAKRPGGKETIVYIDHSELHPFKNHPFQVRDDDAMKSLVDSVKERGIDQAALVRPRDGGGYEIVAGHRRQQASIMAGLKNLPCIVRNMTDDEAVLAMTESNFTYRTEILASERAQALKMQLDAIKRQGKRFDGVANGDIDRRSNEIIADKNNMGAKTVQRYIALNNLTPDMMKLVDAKKVPFMAAYETSFVKPKLQDYIALTVETQGSAPTHPQSQRMRELDAKGILNSDVIDGIMLEEKKEVRQVIISGQELDKYFGADKTPKEMKDTILKLLDEYRKKNPLELSKPDKKKDELDK